MVLVEVYTVVLALFRSQIRDGPRAREEVAVLVERTGHDAVRAVERLFHAVAVVDVDIYVQYPCMILE